MFLLARTADNVTSEACTAKNKRWKDMTSLSVDYVFDSHKIIGIRMYELETVEHGTHDSHEEVRTSTCNIS